MKISQKNTIVVIATNVRWKILTLHIFQICTSIYEKVNKPKVREMWWTFLLNLPCQLYSWVWGHSCVEHICWSVVNRCTYVQVNVFLNNVAMYIVIHYNYIACSTNFFVWLTPSRKVRLNLWSQSLEDDKGSLNDYFCLWVDFRLASSKIHVSNQGSPSSQAERGV